MLGEFNKTTGTEKVNYHSCEKYTNEKLFIYVRAKNWTKNFVELYKAIMTMLVDSCINLWIDCGLIAD